MKEEKRHLTIHELADIVGVSTSALRAWERRYAFFCPERTPGGHRLYTQQDLKLFWFVSHLRSQGLDLKKISTQGREELLRQANEFFELNAPTLSRTQSQTSPPLPAPFEEILSALRKDNVELAMRALEQVYALSSSALTFADHALELMIQVGNHWHSGQITIAAEHAFTARLKHILLGLLFMNNNTSEGTHQPRAVCANLPQEYHELGLLRVSIYLKSWGFRITYLGANTPIEDLQDYCTRIKPDLVVVSCAASLSRSSKLESLQTLHDSVAPLGPVVVGGSGINDLTNHQMESYDLIFLRHFGELEKVAQSVRKYQTQNPTQRFNRIKAELDEQTQENEKKL